MEEKKSSGLLQTILDLPMIGSLAGTVLIFLPFVLYYLLKDEYKINMPDIPEIGNPALSNGIYLCSWLILLEKMGRIRLVVPYIEIRWLWVMLLPVGYGLLILVGIASPE